MPRIELALPGEQRTAPDHVAECYRITVERLDGIACTELEARTAMGVFCMTPPKTGAEHRKTTPRRKKSSRQMDIEDAIKSRATP